MNIIYNTWIDCTDDNYYQTDDDIVWVPSYDSEDKYLYFGRYTNCPYGWNILVRLGAKFMSIELPNNQSNKSDHE